MEECRLKKMLELRELFMKDLASKRPAVLQTWPVNISTKESQQTVRDTVLKGVEEMFESLAHLKNWKPHRTTEVADLVSLATFFLPWTSTPLGGDTGGRRTRTLVYKICIGTSATSSKG
jgi:hypothetical protein